MFPLLLIFFDWFNPTSQTCVIIVDLHNFQFEKEENNMFGVRTFMEDSFHYLVVGNFSFLKRLSILPFACVDCLFLGDSWNSITKCF
jgi:hypothetical protein